MTLFDGILIFLGGTWPAIIAISLILCAVVYSMTESIGWVAIILVVTFILLIPAMIFFLVTL
ncbi:MAG: hypothetical protein WBA88_08170 [Pseudaminobacter sp.]